MARKDFGVTKGRRKDKQLKIVGTGDLKKVLRRRKKAIVKAGRRHVRAEEFVEVTAG